MEEDLEEEDEIPSCASCLSEIIPQEDVVLTQVAYPMADDDGELFLGLELLTDEDLEPVYQPLFHCITCFEEFAGQLHLLNKDRPPQLAEDSAVTCDYCGNGIPFQESCVRFDHGELVISKKTRLPRFVDAINATPLIMCLSCAVQLTGSLDEDEEMGELWIDLSNEDECPRCTFNRCWNGENCHCRCHRE